MRTFRWLQYDSPEIEINYDYDTTGSIEISVGSTRIILPGAMVHEFISTYLTGKKITKLEVE